MAGSRSARELGSAARRLAARVARSGEGTAPAPAELGAAPATDEFITGNGFASHCRHALNYGEPEPGSAATRDWWFCKTDHLERFFGGLAPTTPYVLVTHNSDRPVDGRFLPRLEDESLVAWFAQNAAVAHPKLHAIPIGIANPVWPHGDQAVFRSVRAEAPAKTTLFDVAFDPSTNAEERARCLAEAGLELAPRVPFADHLRRLASAWFCVSPRGNGIDTHRTWEALYVGTIPIVTRSVLTDQHPDLPLVVLDDWSELRAIDFSPELHAETWGGFDPRSLRLDAYLERLDGRLARTVP